MNPNVQTKSDPQALSDLLTQCERLCQRTRTAVEGQLTKRDEFLLKNLDDTVAQLDLILRSLTKDSEGGNKGESAGLLKRLARGFAKKAAGEDEAEELPDLTGELHGLQGNSWTIPIPELLGFLAFGHKTGVLWVDSPDENFLVGLLDGNLVHATSDHTPEGLRLGEILVGFGYLTRRQLERFLETHKDAGDIAGEALLEAGMISDEELHSALVHQTQQLFHRLLSTKNAIFRFREGMRIQLAFHVQLNTTQLLLESARYHDEKGKQPAKHGGQEDWFGMNEELLTELSHLATMMPENQPPAAPPAASPPPAAASVQHTAEATPKDGGAKAEAQGAAKTATEEAKGDPKADAKTEAKTDDKSHASEGAEAKAAADGKAEAEQAKVDDRSDDPDTSGAKDSNGSQRHRKHRHKHKR